MKRVTNPWAAAVLAVLLAVPLLPVGQARAESEVLESDAQELPVGTKIADDKRIVIPEGKKLRVLVASGNTRTLNGPYEGTVADYKEDLTWWERITGRKKEGDAPIGATRGLKPQN